MSRCRWALVLTVAVACSAPAPSVVPPTEAPAEARAATPAPVTSAAPTSAPRPSTTATAVAVTGTPAVLPGRSASASATAVAIPAVVTGAPIATAQPAAIAAPPAIVTPATARPLPAATAAPGITGRAGPASASAEVVARGLDTPWGLAFAPDGRLFVTERPGRVRVIQGGTLLAEPWATLNVSEKDMAERGLMGIAIDPGFAGNGYVYLAYTYRSGTRDVNRLVRMRDSGGRGVDETVLVDGAGGGDNHDGGRLKIGPDGKLWWTLGEAGGPQNVAQLPDRINGKILRIELDGSVPADNPTRGSYVWSMGHRNPQGIAWHPDTGALYATEHGPSMNGTSFCCHDEVNLIVAGGNYGWPTVWGIAGDARFLDPVLESGATTTWAPGGATFVSSGPFRGSLVFGTLAGQHLHRVVFGGDGRTVAFEERLLVSTYGRLRDVIEGPDGALYVATSNRDGRAFPKPDDDKILRVVLR